jgi:carbonic anhydrase
LLNIYSKPELWSQLYEKISSEYNTLPEYLASVEKFKDYKHLITNNSMIYFKLTKPTNKSMKFQYKKGLNVDTQEFKPSGCCSGGGLYFCELKDVYQFINFGKYLTPIIVPKNIPIYGYIYDVRTGRLVEVPAATAAGKAS